MLPVIVLCEGKEDISFLRALIAHREIGAFDFHKPNGTGAFTRMLTGLRTGSDIRERKAILIVSDNDGDPDGQFEAIRMQITEAGWIAPETPRAEAAQEGMPSIHVLMLPWDDDQGCLETLCLIAATNANPEEMKCVEQLVTCVEAKDLPVPMLSKLRMRCYISSVCKTDPNTGLRYAWSRPQTLIPMTDPCFDKLAAYLRSVA